MFSKATVVDMINRSAENEADRRLFLKSAGLAGAGAVGAATLGGLGLSSASAGDGGDGVSDAAVLNFALNLEYLEAEFYSYASFGHGIDNSLTHGKGNRGPVVGGRKVTFKSNTVRNYAREIAKDEIDHVRFLRSALGSAAVSRPKIDLKNSFAAAAKAAGLGGGFDPFKDETSFLLGAFIFEDVGVTAYKGAAPLISNKLFLEAAAGILAVEAYHASLIRTVLYSRDLQSEARAISNARDSLDGNGDKDQGIGTKKTANIVPTNSSGLAFSRSAGQVLNIVYLTPDSVGKGGFLPQGANGAIHLSAQSA